MTNVRFQRYRPMRSRQRGFSLLEIMIVVVLIGLIGAFAASKILGGADTAKYKLAQAAIPEISGKIEQFQMDVGTLPQSLQELTTAPSGASGWLGPYAREKDLKDPWGRPFEYRQPGENGKRFDLISYGADGQPGGDSTKQDVRNE